MRFDLPLIAKLCRKLGVACVARGPNAVAIDLGDATTLLFQNEEAADDCLVGFEGTPWHTHGDFMWSDQAGA